MQCFEIIIADQLVIVNSADKLFMNADRLFMDAAPLFMQALQIM